VIDLRAGVDGTVDAGTASSSAASMAGSGCCSPRIDGGLAVRAQTGRDASFVLSRVVSTPDTRPRRASPLLTRITITIAD
jgi:hypothetical protein